MDTDNKTVAVQLTKDQLGYLRFILEKTELRGAEVPRFLELVRVFSEQPKEPDSTE